MTFEEQKALSAKITDSTILYRLSEWIDNFNANLKYIVGGLSVTALLDTMINVPCIIVGAGRALDTNLREMQSLSNRAVIISPDSTLKALLKRDIKPHIVFITDSKEHISDYLLGTPIEELNFVADSFIHPKTSELLRKAKRLYWYNIAALDRCPFTHILDSKTGFIGRLASGGCVGTIAWWFAKEVLGCNPDILAGMSFAFYEPKSESYANIVQDTIKTNEYKVEPITMVDMWGRECYTFTPLLSFVNWFHRKFVEMPGIHINCSQMGLLKENVLNLPFSYVKDKILVKEYDIENQLFIRERIIDAVIKIRKDVNISKYRSLLVLLTSGPSLRTIALRMGWQEDIAQREVDYLIGIGLNITKQSKIENGIYSEYYLLNTK